MQSVVCPECHQCMLLGLIAMLAARSMADVMQDVNLSSGRAKISPRCQFSPKSIRLKEC